jgi:calpain-7
VTVGTGDLTPSQETEFGLVANHNYSIFGTSIIKLIADIIDKKGHRLLKIRNPWSRGGVPKSSFDFSAFWKDLPGTSMDGYTPGDPSLGTFWLDYNTLCQHFKTLYLNWNPALFPHRAQKHFSFTPTGSDYDVGTNGQYTISVQGTSDVWVLVERHYLGKSEGWNGYLGLAVFQGNERIYSYTRPAYRVLPMLSC